MVFFTCEHCGESVKKPRVEKHYNTICRNRNVQLTCVDCLKTFVGSAFETHTKCISEEDRYSAAGLSSVQTVSKGDRKQESWSNCIEKCLEDSSLNPQQINLIQGLLNHPNVPRKKNKFMNFVNSAFRNMGHVAGDVFDKIDELSKNSKNEKEENAESEEKKSSKEKSKKVSDEVNANGVEESNIEEEQAEKKKKKKKRKHEKEENDASSKKKGKISFAELSFCSNNGIFNFDWEACIRKTIDENGKDSSIPLDDLFDLTKSQYLKALFLYHLNKISNIEIVDNKVTLTS